MQWDFSREQVLEGTVDYTLEEFRKDAFEATTVSLFETSADDWNAHWWHTLRWRHLRSWTLPRA